jgi:hypothetical protein
MLPMCGTAMCGTHGCTPEQHGGHVHWYAIGCLTEQANLARVRFITIIIITMLNRQTKLVNCKISRCESPCHTVHSAHCFSELALPAVQDHSGTLLQDKAHPTNTFTHCWRALLEHFPGLQETPGATNTLRTCGTAESCHHQRHSTQAHWRLAPQTSHCVLRTMQCRPCHMGPAAGSRLCTT